MGNINKRYRGAQFVTLSSSPKSERFVETKIRQAVTARGGLCLKFVSPGFAGVPDRLILLPGGRVGFVEVKRLGAKPRPLQVRRHQQLQALGFKVFTLDDHEKIGGVLDDL